MRIWVLSDLHVDAATYELPPTPAGVDVIIIAGDVADGHHKSARWLRERAVPRGLPIIYVAGNHDFYGYSLGDDPVGLMNDIGVQLLHERRPMVEIAGVRFVGSTLWTDYEIAGDVDAARAWARECMPDTQSIDFGRRRISPRDLLDAHQRQRLAIDTELFTPFDGTTIVVTHHAPHPNSLRNPLFRDESDGSFASDLTETINAYEPAVWLHGHVHSSRDYYVSATRVVCNPRGYAVAASDGRRIENSAFDPLLIVEI